MLERGFEYFLSPEKGDGEERIAYAFLYCSTAVEEWPRWRREMRGAGAMSKERQCPVRWQLLRFAINEANEVAHRNQIPR
jgi:hypothetical protein